MMKDITDYFSSPTKARKSLELVENLKSTQKFPVQNVNRENEIKDESSGFKVSKDKPKKAKKKRSRKPTDPEVRGVTELLSNNLSLISPNTSGTKIINSPSKQALKKSKRSSLGETIQKEAKGKSNGDIKSQLKSDDLIEHNAVQAKDNADVDNSFNKASKAETLKEPKDNSKNIQNNSESKPITIDIKDTESDSEMSNNTPKVNAFQFLMNSRNNIIGQNSDGIVLDERENNITDQTSKLATRKELFKNWADHRGGLKRRREEEQKEKCINSKMEKRTKRLKKMLQGKTEKKSCKRVENKKSPVKNRKIVKIPSSSDSENSNGVNKNELSKEHEISNSCLVNINEIIEENAQDINVTMSSPSSKKCNGQNNLLNFFGVLNKESIEDRIEIFDDTSTAPSKDIIKIKMFTPESTKKRTSLVSLNRERTKSMTDESSQEHIKIKKHKKKKKKNINLEGKSKNESRLNDSLKDFCSPEVKKDNSSVNTLFKKKDVNKSSKHKFCNKAPKSNPSKKYKNNKIKNKIKESEEKDLVSDFKENVLAVDESSQDSDIIQPRKKNSKRNIIADDSEESRSSLEQVVSIVKEKSAQDSSNSKSKIKEELKLGVIDDDDSQDLKNSVEEQVVVVDDSVKDQQKNFNEDSTLVTTRNKKKIKIKAKDSAKVCATLKDEDDLKQDHPETPGRVLRKRNNLNYSDFFKSCTEQTSKSNNEETSSVKKTKKSSNKDESIEKVELSSDSDHEETLNKKLKAPVKVAPVFLKATPKPKLDPEVVEARKKFLLSGVPEALKITIEKQKSLEETDYDIFPSISHVQQKCQSRFWNLPKTDLKYTKEDPSLNLSEHSLTFQDLTVTKVPYEVNITTETEKINCIKSQLDKIKSANPDYPVYKVFRHIYEKSGKNFLKDRLKETKSPKRRSKKTMRKSSEMMEVLKSETASKDYQMWSEKYKPKSSEEILGNHNAVSTLKNWLETWMKFSEEINARGKRKRTNSNSESEFESTDCDSRDSTRLPGNTIILAGPCGSGKTSAVYAIANELGYNVLELNASSKRTGKRLIQELQEATQSHQVRKNQIQALANYLNSDKTTSKNLKDKKSESKTKKTDPDEKNDQKDKKKMCILLVEDIDLVFDQDEGFLTSLFQLITTSKRPIILTTTDSSPTHLQKLIAQYEYTSFMPLSLQCLGVWLQILCLVEEILVDKDDLGNLLEYNKGDIRKTLLEVQFWGQSGGQLEKSRLFPFKTETSSSNSAKCDLKSADEELQIVLNENGQDENYFVHKNCLGSFEITRENKEYNIPQYLNIGVLWWNMPNILDIPGLAGERLSRTREPAVSSSEGKDETNNVIERDKSKLDSLMDLYDALTLTDSLFNTINFHASNEPIVKNWSTDVKDSLELTERTEDQGIGLDMVHELTHTLVNGCIQSYRSIDETSCKLNMALPDTHERRWRAKQHICDDFLKEPIPIANILDRSSIALDYLPTLRDIARHEEERSASNTKRGNRFRHYLKNLNMNFKESTCKLVCNILSSTDD